MKLRVTADRLKNPCEGCKGHFNGQIVKSLCCQSFIFPAPVWDEDPKCVDYDYLMMYMTRAPLFRVRHNPSSGNATALASDWKVELMEKCGFLRQDGDCTIYEKRPVVCVDFSPFPTKGDAEPEFCDRYSSVEDKTLIFKDMFELAAFWKEHLGFDYLKLQKAAAKNLEYDPAYIEVIK